MEIFVALFYGGILRYGRGLNNVDRLVLSKGHASAVMYPILKDLDMIKGHDIKQLGKKNGYGAWLQPELDGIDWCTWSLGNGLGVATGMALASKNTRTMHNGNNSIFCIVGDAECQEGSIWESAMLAGNLGLNNLCCIVDRNGIGAIDWTENANGLEPFAYKWESFGWDVVSVHGHLFEQLLQLKLFKERKSKKPFCLIANTIKGKGLANMENDSKWHGKIPTGREAETAKRILGIK
jgi:transketolase